MMIPTIDQMTALSGPYDVIPLGREMYADTLTPISILQRLSAASPRTFLLESVEGGERWSRYSFLGFEPVARIACREGVVRVSRLRADGSVESETAEPTRDPFAAVQRFLDERRAPHLPELPPFTGGLVGYFGYRCYAYAEPTLSLSGEGEDFELYYFDKVVAIDHLRQKLWVLVHMRAGDAAGERRRAEAEIERITAVLRGDAGHMPGAYARERTGCVTGADAGAGHDAGDPPYMESIGRFDAASVADVFACGASATDGFDSIDGTPPGVGKDSGAGHPTCAETPNREGDASTPCSPPASAPLACSLDAAAYADMVARAQSHIREGDIFQAVLSRRFEGPYPGDLLAAYRVLRTTNPSPYMVYMRLGDVELMCASPETLVKLSGGMLTTFPIAGSRPRGATPEEDAALERELLRDEKELAEHHMLVDLARNDLGRISEIGSVRVSDRLAVHRFSRIMHLTTTVTGALRAGLHPLDAVRAMLPAGTLSGAPKVRACQIIEELEPTPRGIYGGAIGYIDLSGNLDACIAIRMAVKRDGRVCVQAGGGIVADSVAEREYEESGNKAAAVVDALMRAGEVAL